MNKIAKRRHKPRHSFHVTGKTKGQKQYLQSINDNEITICSGFAGTGKTLIAIGMAMSMYQKDDSYSKILIVRPAIEACNEKLGFLPGGINEKMRPLIQPIVDSLRFFIKDEGYLSSLLPSELGTGPIEISSLAYMRGRTFNNCIVVFDEAQNSSPQQMKLFLTRIGDNCKVIIEGDVTQSDLSDNPEDNGLFDAIKRLRGVKGIGIVALEMRDIVRSAIVARILERY